MIKQEFTLDDKWLVRVMYSLGQGDTMEAMKALHELKCPRKNAIQAYSVISSGINKGFTYTNHLLHTTLIYIGVSSDQGAFINTIVHEAKHAQSNICSYFKIREDGEEAAELIAYIVQKMWEDFNILLKVNYNE
jgi:hypothetical protein